MFEWRLIAKDVHYRIFFKFFKITFGQYIMLSKNNDNDLVLTLQRYIGISEKCMYDEKRYYYNIKLYNFLKKHLHKEIRIICEENIIKSKFIKYEIVYENIPSYLRDKKLEKLLK